jgi:hypothetical protein
MATLGNATVNAFFLPGSNVARQHTIVNATGDQQHMQFSRHLQHD